MNNSLIFEYSPWFILLCIAIAFAFSFILYFRDKKLEDLSKKKLYLLASLRFLSVFFISGLLLSPLIETTNTKVEKPLIIFAFDNSQSIKLASENNSNLKNIEKKLLKIPTNISKKYNIKIFTFDRNINDSIKLNFTGQRTDIANLISQINNKFYNRNIGALIIASDGIFNTGENPLYIADKTNYPIYTIGLGDTTIYQDIFIKNIIHNDIAFLNNQFPVSLTIGAKKLKGQKAELKIFSHGKIVFTKKIEINSNNFLTKINLFLKAAKQGTQEYQVNIKIDKKERNILNNNKNFAIKVLKNKQKILILANSPHPDIAALYNSLKSNSNFDVDIAFAGNFSKKITDYSLVILHNLPSKQNPENKIFAQLKKAGIPLIIVVGMQTNLNLLNAQNLGLSISQSNKIFDAVQAYLNPNFKDFEISSGVNNMFKTGPPLKVPFASFSFIPQMKALFLQTAKGIKTNKPLILLSSGNEHYPTNIIFILGENFWRLRIYDYRKNENFDLFNSFIQQLAQYSVLKSKKNHFIVKVDKIIPENNDILFRAEVYDKIFQLVNDNDVNIVLSDSAGNKYNYLFDKTTNAYKLDIGNFPVGHYNYIAKTKYDNKTLENKGSFIVIPINIEAQNLIANHDLLRKMSIETGGKFLSIENSDSLQFYLKENKNIVPVTFSSQDISEIIIEKWLFFFILLLISLEWFLRKFFGTY